MRVKATYGALANQLTFLVILREPLARMQSSFYHGKSSGWVNVQFGSFEQYIQSALTVYRQKKYRKFHDTAWSSGTGPDFNGVSGIPLTLSLYHEQLAHWLYYFHPAQFIVSPMKAYTKTTGAQDLVRAVGSRPHVQASFPWQKKKLPKPHLNKHPHPPVERDLHPQTLQQIRGVLNTVTGAQKLAQLLQPAMRKGLLLYGYNGPPTMVPRISKFINDNW